MTFSNIKDLRKYLEQNITSVLENEMSDTVKGSMAEAVDRTVYSTYRPKMYQRRQDRGGLSDKDNMTATVDGNILEVENNTPLNNDHGINRSGKTLTEIVTSGENYMFSGAFEVPRDFIEETRRDLKENDTVRKTMKTALQKRGLDVRD